MEPEQADVDGTRVSKQRKERRLELPSKLVVRDDQSKHGARLFLTFKDESTEIVTSYVRKMMGGRKNERTLARLTG